MLLEDRKSTKKQLASLRVGLDAVEDHKRKLLSALSMITPTQHEKWERQSCNAATLRYNINNFFARLEGTNR